MTDIDGGLNEIAVEITRLAKEPVKERLRFWAEFFRDYPYVDSPLGEGLEKPRVRTDGFDCMTYVETCLALAISESAEDILPNLDRIRYRDGVADFEHRNHFVSLDWLPNNSWLLRPLDEFSDRSVTRDIDRAAFFEKNGHRLSAESELAAVEHIESRIISPSRFAEISPARLDCTVVMLAGRLDWLVVSHMGLLFAESDQLILRHASSVHRKVVELTLSDYFDVNTSLRGAICAEIADDR